MRAAFPHLALSQTAQFYLAGQSLETQESISGTDTVVPTLRGRWAASASFVLNGEAATLQWQAFLAQMQGRIGTTLVPARSRFRPKDRNGRPTPFCDVGGVAGTQTMEHFGFESSNPLRVVTSAAAPLRATEMGIVLNDSTGLRPGQYFGVGDRLYRVQQHWQGGSNTHRILFDPPLREAVGSGVRLEVEKPVCKMRMVTEREGLFDQALSVLPVVTLSFQEAL